MIGQYWKKLAEYFDNGNMPFKVYAELPEDLQKRYKRRWIGKGDHIHGRPMTAKERKIRKRHAKERKHKNKRERQARKITRRKNKRK